MDSEVERGGQKHTLLSTLCESYLRLAVADILKVAWRALKDVHAAESSNDGIQNENRKIVWGEPGKNRDCNASGAVCREVVLRDAREVHFGEYEKTTYSSSGLLRSILPVR